MPKGARNERKKCRDWSLWWSEGLDINPPKDDIFYRTAGSGSRAKSRAKRGKDTHGSYGDMGALDPVGEPLIKALTFEFKKGYNKELDLLSLLDSRGKKPLLKQFLEQVCEDAELAGNDPALVIHRDYHLPVIVILAILIDEIHWYVGGFKNDRFDFWYMDKDFTMMRLKDFFEWCNPHFFVRRGF